MKDSDWRRTDTFFFGSMLVFLLLSLTVVWFDIKWFDGTVIESTWISMVWLFSLFVVIIPVRFFPKTRWAKWWNSTRGERSKLTD